MVTLKRFFHAEKSTSASPRNGATRASNTPESNLSSNGRAAQFLGAGQPFQRIEKQFEVLHDQLPARPLSPPSKAPPSRASSRTTARNPRHVDLLEALFSSHRYHMQSAQVLSPISPYNEDVAERNMTRFLQGQSGKPEVYSRIMSALYEEDVADTTMARNRNGGRPYSCNSIGRSRGNSFQRSNQGRQDETCCRPRSKAGCRLTRSMSQEAPRSMSPSHAGRLTFSPQDLSSASESSLRQQKSVPNFQAEPTDSSHRESELRSSGYLGIPPAYKQGDTWSSTPLPDSPTLPIIVTGVTEHESQPTKNPPSRSSLASRSHSSLNPTKSKKNVRDLSIDTELASRSKSTSKISHRVIQPPTTSSFGIQQNTIAEVMNSPLPKIPSTSPSPSLQSDQKIAEMMDMFKQACTSSPAISPHPTYEALQDAIIREINSHEAFRRVPLPEPGPPFTPSSSQAAFYPEFGPPKSEGTGTNRTMSLKEGQISKLLRRGSSKKQRQGSDTHQSVSTSVPPKVFWKSSETSGRRRHTDAPLPPPGFLNTLEPSHPVPKEQVTYMDLLFKSKKFTTNISPKRTPDTGKTLGYPQSLGIVSSGFPGNSNPAPSVFHMRAQASASSVNNHVSLSEDDSDDEVIELPSVGIPQLQIRGIDQNNVTYTAENTTPRSAFKLMSWPQRSGRSASFQGDSISNENNNGPSLPPSRGGLTTRSVRTY
ncbi:hypothetical protein BDV28DRAFT_134376 [Aspergillus coremiiformis]|uniref:Uncharacterized protein n=1 Tax=Aspergillus coremiiformis TaxID=138285 RepID=A0A5N6Z614_9EURO|nr:hypothetical protein BDV28DRAFT_134376 [Aspergillus coremiiformis]